MKQNKKKEKGKTWCIHGTRGPYYKNMVMTPYVMVSRCHFASTKALA